MHDVLCDTRDLPEGHSKSVTLTREDAAFEIFVVQYRGQFYAYENHCPHTGITLNWQPDQFLDFAGQRIQCATHGALFRITDGLCEWGPCIGKHLRPLVIEERDEQLVLINKGTS
jgi:nitrite reductase/ring-hydroxylating ferredoxin subunit